MAPTAMTEADKQIRVSRAMGRVNRLTDHFPQANVVAESEYADLLPVTPHILTNASSQSSSSSFSSSSAIAPHDANGYAIAGGLALVGAYLMRKYEVARDVRFVIKLGKLQSGARDFLAAQRTAADIFESQCDAHPDKACIVFEGKNWAWKDVEAAANRFSNWALAKGLKKGDVVALIMENRPEYVAVWLGLSKVGVVTALINTNLRGKPLVHSVGISHAKLVIIDNAMAGQVLDTLREGQPQMVYHTFDGASAGATSIDGELKQAATTRPPKSVRAGIKSTDPLFYIYTSGTTGLPKAAVIKHMRFFLMGASAVILYELQPSDRVYCCLPLYHSAGGSLGVGMCWGSGATMVLARKFSATNFFADCAASKATVMQYIGELCRYLVLSPPTANDKNHLVRKAIGNGLRPDVWGPFVGRFGITTVCEFYGSTEGNAALFNAGMKQGAVGFMPPLFSTILPLFLVQFDVVNEVPIRGKNGFCVTCAANETGELLGKIDMNDPLLRFDGYLGSGNTEKKILRDVFVKGDAYFRTGDLLKSDGHGFYYFVDRIGDTFRWKGENVSTNEVAEVINVFKGCRETNVYGVQIPGQDGRAGMACLIMDDTVDLAQLYKYVCDNLPHYSRPIFLRKTKEIEITGTFKHRKVELVKEGFDPAETKEPVFIIDNATKTYRPITDADLKEITSGTRKL